MTEGSRTVPSLVAPPARPPELSRGVAVGFAAYGLWGLFPLLFDAMKPAGAWEILAHRILWTLLFCVLALVALRDVAWIRPVLRQPKLLGGITLAAVAIATNWVVYVAAVTAGHTSDAALGYFLNPLVTVALGVLVLRERLRPLQWAAVGVGAAAAVYLAVAAGRMPLTALVLACSFASYGLIKNRVGAHLPALQGLTVETAVLTPAAAIILVVLGLGPGLTFAGHGAVHTGLLIFSGVATAVPLLLFAAAARRIPLVTVGLLQFITPVLQLLCAVLLLGERVPAERWIGFGIVWVALILLTADSLLALRGRHPATPAAPAPSESTAPDPVQDSGR